MKNYQFPLINSTYSAQEAHEVLVALITSKIRFLSQKAFSLQVRFGSDTEHLKRRMEELQAEKRTLELMLEEFDKEEAEFQIRCDVRMTVQTPAEA